jgi:hypothetical protein
MLGGVVAVADEDSRDAFRRSHLRGLLSAARIVQWGEPE